MTDEVDLFENLDDEPESLRGDRIEHEDGAGNEDDKKIGENVEVDPKILEDMKSALETISVTEIKFLKSMVRPPQVITLVLETVSVLLNEGRPVFLHTGTMPQDSWKSCRTILLRDPKSFITKLEQFNKDNIPPHIMKTVREKYISDPEFNPESANSKSLACYGLCRWVLAIDQYDRLVHGITPREEDMAKSHEQTAHLNNDEVDNSQTVEIGDTVVEEDTIEDTTVGVNLAKLEASKSVINSLNIDDLVELKAFTNPPAVIKFVLEAVSVLLNVQAKDKIDRPLSGKTLDPWLTCKHMLRDTRSLLELMKQFDKDNIPPGIMKKIREKYIAHPDFNPDAIKKKSKACHGLCQWVLAIDQYDRVIHGVTSRGKDMAIPHKQPAQLNKSEVVDFKTEETDNGCVKEKKYEKTTADVDPVLLEAIQSNLNSIRYSDLSELKALSKPPAVIKFVLEAVCVLLNVELQDKFARPRSGKTLDPWVTCKHMLRDTRSFIEHIKQFDKDNIPSATMKKIREKYIADPEFNPDRVKSKSLACYGLCRWVLAIDQYDRLVHGINPREDDMSITHGQPAQSNNSAVVDTITEKADNGCVEEKKYKKTTVDVDPALLEASQSALSAIHPSDLSELRVFSKPPATIKLVLEAVSVLLNVEVKEKVDPARPGKTVKDSWATCKHMLATRSFYENLRRFDKDNIPPCIMQEVREKYIAHPNFNPEIVKRNSMACCGLCKWVLAIDEYDRLVHDIASAKGDIDKCSEQPEPMENTDEMDDSQTMEDACAEVDRSIVDATMSAVMDLGLRDIVTLRSLSKPPLVVRFVLEAVSVLLNFQGMEKFYSPHTEEISEDSWRTCKLMLREVSSLKQKIATFDKDNIPPPIMKMIREKYISDPKFDPENVKNISMTLLVFCEWVLAIDKYDRLLHGITIPRGELEGRVQSKLLMPENRQQIVDDLLQKIHIAGDPDGEIDVEDVQRVYNPRGDLKYLRGDMDEGGTLQCFLKRLNVNKNGKISRADFLRYYSCLSECIDEDQSFESFIQQTWDFRNVNLPTSPTD